MKKAVLFLFLLLALPWGLWAQDFAPLYGNLDRLEFLLDESLNLTESTLADNANLKTALRNLEELLRTQGELLTEQRNAWEEQREISGRQSRLLGTYAARSKRLTFSLIIAVPAALGLGILGGLLLAR
jgi:hypothetical protein